MPCRTYSKRDGMSLEDSEQEWYDLINILNKSLWLQHGKLLEQEWKQDNWMPTAVIQMSVNQGGSDWRC